MKVPRAVLDHAHHTADKHDLEAVWVWRDNIKPCHGGHTWYVVRNNQPQPHSTLVLVVDSEDILEDYRNA